MLQNCEACKLAGSATPDARSAKTGLIVLGAYQVGVFLPLRNASWTLASTVEIDVDKKTTTGMKGAVVHRDWKTGAPDNIDIPSAMAGPTCHLLARSIEHLPKEAACQPAVRKV